MVSDKILLPFTTEDKNGIPEKPNAYVVILKIYNPGSKMYSTPDRVTREWNVRIKSDEKGGTTINVNLVQIEAFSSTFISKTGSMTTYTANAFSTGVIEKFIYETIK